MFFLFSVSNSYGQKRIYKKAKEALSERNIPLATDLILEIKVTNKSAKLANNIEAEILTLVNQLLNVDSKLAIDYFNNAKSISGKFKKELWSPEHIETGLNIAYKLKSNCEANSDSSSMCYDKSKKIYESILAKDEFNWNANYNLGAMLYQRAVFKIKQLDYETDIFTIEATQDECIKLFFSALPYLKKAYKLNPQERVISQSLSQLYLSLNDEQKAEEYLNE